MKRTLSIAIVLTLLVAAVLPLAGCQRKVTVKTGEIVLCTAGEIIEDNTEEIEVSESEAADYSVTTTVITCEEHSDLGRLYSEAQQAILAGDLDAARVKLQAILDRDPTYRKAKDQLAAIDDGQTPSADDDTTDPGATDPGTTDPGDEPIGPVVNLAKWVPDAIDGYTAQGIIADVASLSRQYIPKAKAADQLVIAVDQVIDAAAATAGAKALTVEYPEKATTKTIGGFAVTAGARGEFAAASFADGPLVVVVELHSTGDAGTSLIDEVLAVVAAITR